MHINQGRYADLSFPFERIEMPPLHAEAQWTLERVRGFMATWSASQRYHAAHGREANDVVAADLERAWGGNRTVPLRRPLHVLVGRIPS